MRFSCAAPWLLALLAAQGSGAATGTTTFTVNVTIPARCSVSATGLPFGAYSPGNGSLETRSVIRLLCTRDTPYTVSLDAGTTPGANLMRRAMAFGEHRLAYNLYTSAAFTTVFGDGSAGTAVNTGVGAGLKVPQSLTVYGRLPDDRTNQSAAPGHYSDTITVTVAY